MDRTLSELIKELLVIIDELRVIDSPQPEDVNDSLMYTADFVDTYEAIRQRMEELGELPPHLGQTLQPDTESASLLKAKDDEEERAAQEGRDASRRRRWG